MLITPTVPGDLAAIEALLRASGLPMAGVRGDGTMLFAGRVGGDLAACAGLEWHGRYALLRSVAVAPAYQGRGLGGAVTAAALDAAAARGADAVFLLTTTAEPFFARRGFETIPRADVPAEVQASVEFTTACPASATVMRKRLAPVL